MRPTFKFAGPILVAAIFFAVPGTAQECKGRAKREAKAKVTQGKPQSCCRSKKEGGNGKNAVSGCRCRRCSHSRNKGCCDHAGAEADVSCCNKKKADAQSNCKGKSKEKSPGSQGNMNRKPRCQRVHGQGKNDPGSRREACNRGKGKAWHRKGKGCPMGAGKKKMGDGRSGKSIVPGETSGSTGKHEGKRHGKEETMDEGKAGRCCSSLKCKQGNRKAPTPPKKDDARK